MSRHSVRGFLQKRSIARATQQSIRYRSMVTVGNEYAALANLCSFWCNEEFAKRENDGGS